jgi:DNA-binding NarL/FixJ family response regulator
MLGDGIELACAGAGDLEVVARVASTADLGAAARAAAAHVAVLSPAPGGAARVGALRSRPPRLRTLLLTGAESPEELLRAVEAGAAGYLSIKAALTELVEGIRGIAHGQTLVPPAMLAGLLRSLVDRRRQQQEALLKTAGLTRREREVLCLLTRGMDTTGIAKELVISRETARTHVQNVLTKLEVHSRLEAAAFVNESGVLEDLARLGRAGAALGA